MVVAGILLVSPVLVFLMVIAAEVLIDGLMEAGVTAVCAVTVGVLGSVLFRRFRQPSDRAAPQSGPGVVSEGTAIAAQPV